MLSMQDADNLLFKSYMNKGRHLQGNDSQTRNLNGIRDLLNRAGIALNRIPAITVTGSKGKGSTAIFTSALLVGRGYRVGLLTSPSYLSLRERMRVNGQAIAEADYRRIVTELAPLIDNVDGALPQNQYLSPTGLFLAVALRYFHQQNVDALVLEVGRGGRFDDVSLIHNQVSLVTPITDEHLEQLGPTVRDVAWHKAGIIKTDSQVVSAEQSEAVRAILEDHSRQQSATLRWVIPERDYHVMRDQRTQTVILSGTQFQINQVGRYLPDNLALAIKGVDALLPYLPTREVNIPQIQHRLRTMRLFGRTQHLQSQPDVWLDGAINGTSADLFRESVLPYSPQPRVLVTALPRDKDYVGLLQTLAPYVDTAIITRVSAGHLTFDDDVVNTARKLLPHVQDIPDVTQAFTAGLEQVLSAGTLWIVGTQSLVRDALAFWKLNLENLHPDQTSLV